MAALQENEDAKHARVRADYQAGLIDLYTAQTALGLASDESRRGVYYGDGPGGEAVKAIWREELHPRDRRGRFTDGGYHFHYLPARDAQGGEPDDRQDRYSVDDGEYAQDLRRIDGDLQPHFEKAFRLCEESFNRGEVSRELQHHYWGIMHRVLRKMPPAALARAVDNLKAVRLYGSIEELNFSIHGDETKNTLGMYDPETWTMHLDGNKSRSGYSLVEIYAHELGHSIDGFFDEMSASEEWKRAWRSEMYETPNAPRRARVDASEGFAEFARMVFATGTADSVKTKYPLCYAFWKAHDLIA